MDLQLTHRHVLITGGSKGIGLACAKAFLDEGARVTLIARQPATLAQAQAQLPQNHALILKNKRSAECALC